MAAETEAAAGQRPPLFLVGAPRSGTSLVYRTLCLHPEAAFISNWLRRRPGWGALSLLNRMPRSLPGLRLKYWFGEESNAYRFDKARPVAERLFPAPIEGGPLFDACGLGEGASGPFSAESGRRLRAAFAALTRYGGGSVVVSKRIINNRFIPELAAAFPGARFVSIMRDGRAVAYSLSRVDWWSQSSLWWLGMTAEQAIAGGRDLWDLCAQEWVEEVGAVEAGLATVDQAQVLRVAYEDLVARPIESLQEMARFGGLDASAAWLDALRQVRFANQNEAWRARLQPEQVERIMAVQGDLLRRHGYN